MLSEKSEKKLGSPYYVFEIMQHHLCACMNYDYVCSKDFSPKTDDRSFRNEDQLAPLICLSD